MATLSARNRGSNAATVAHTGGCIGPPFSATTVRCTALALVLYLWTSAAQPFDPHAAVEQVAVEVAFTPGNEAAQLIIATLNGARERILVQVFSFTNRDIARALIAARARGVDVEIISDAMEALRHAEPQVSLLNLAVPLLFSWMLTQLAIYGLGRALAPGDPLRYWEKVIAWAIWIGFALYVTGALPEIARILDGFGFHIGKQRISLLTILEGLLSLALSVLIAMWVGRLIEDRLMRVQGVDINLRVVFSKLVRTLLILAAVFVALPAVGIDITVLSVFGGALGVGIGFGLQKIAANYFSGFLILLDRSVSLGALVTIEGYYGEVRRLNARYMVVKGMDGTEAIIPNEMAITSMVINHSYTDPRVRIDIPIQISYQSDVELALDLLTQAALAQPRALRDPAPTAVLKGFAESGIDLELYTWIADPELGKANIRSDIYRNLWQSFRSQGIEIPYPQREIRVLPRTPPSART